MTERPAVRAAEVPEPSSSLVDRLVHLWSVRLPRFADSWATRLGDAFADGAWTARWPVVAAFAPVIAFVVGLLFPILWPGMKEVYTESLVFLTVIVAGAILSGPVGVMLMAGYVVGDLVAVPSSYRSWELLYLSRKVMGDIVSYMLLALPTAVLPQIGRKMSEEIAARLSDDDSAGQVAVSAGLYAAVMGILTFLWCQAMIVLVRPVFTFLKNSPTTEAVIQVQHRWVWLAAVAGAAAIVRVVLQYLARRGPAAAGIRALEQQRWSSPQMRGALWRKVPLVVRITIAALVATLMLSGTYVTIGDGVIVFAAIVAVKGWRRGLFGSIPPWWIRAMSKIPTLGRFVTAPLLGFALAYVILLVSWRSGSLRPVMLGALLTFMFVQLLFPGVPVAPKAQESPS